jgi:hypothetical protein
VPEKPAKDVDAVEVIARDTSGELRHDEEPPVVARLVVEIRSDGSRTIARGALEDTASGQTTTLEARGDSPLSLALQLARALTQLPRLTARSAVRGLLGRRRDKRP